MSQQQYQSSNYKLINFNVPHYMVNNFDEIVKFKRISRTSVLIGLMERYIRAEHNYYEVICLSDSLMSDRLGKLLQVVRRYDEEKYVTGSLGQTVHTLKREMEDRGLDFGEDFDRLLDAVSGCEDSFDNKRNTSVHEFCVVTEDNLKYRVKNRDNFNKATAQLGATLTKCIVRDVDQILRKIYNDEFYGEE